MPKTKTKKNLLKHNLRGWYLLIIAALVLLTSTLFNNVAAQVTLQITGYVLAGLAVLVEITDIVKKKDARLQIDLFMTALAVVLVIMAGYFILSESARHETQVLRSSIQKMIPGIEASLPQDSHETGGILSHVWVSSTENYVFVEYTTSKDTPATASVDETTLKPYVVKLLCDDTKYRSVLDSGWGYTFLYTGTSSGDTYQVNVTKKDC